MSHFAKINEDNIVVDVIVINNNEIGEPQFSFPETEQKGIDFINELAQIDSKFLGNWKQTSYNGSFRKQYAQIGSTYDEENDIFINPKPFNSWTLNDNFDWIPPVPKPGEDTEDMMWVWREPTSDLEQPQHLPPPEQLPAQWVLIPK